MKVGAIDMGTNSSRLLIADYNKGRLKVLKRDLVTTRLGEGVDENRKLSREAIKRGKEALEVFKRELKKYGVNTVKVVGTSALREVSNSYQLREYAENIPGFYFRIVSGSEEAALVYSGVTMEEDIEDILVLDIGGGSTEFVWKDREGVDFKSLNIGAVRMTERYTDSDSGEYNQKKSRQEINNFLEEHLKNKNFLQTKGIIGVGGTITTLAAIEQGLVNYDREKIHGHILSLESVIYIMARLKGMDLKERKKVAGLQRERADIIVAGIEILFSIMKKFSVRNIRVSEHDILYGIVNDHFNGLDSI